MKKSLDILLSESLIESGFSRNSVNKNLFLIDSGEPIAPAFLCAPIRRLHNIRFGGAFGLYFKEFETLWSRSVSRKEAELGFSLPLTMLIDNYLDLIDGDVFDFSQHPDEMRSHAVAIHKLCNKLPKSIEQFAESLNLGSMLGKDISKYFHIADYNADDNIFLLKSVNFVNWFVMKWPEHADKLYQCLSISQLRRVKRLT